MAEGCFFGKNGLASGILGSAATLALCAPLAPVGANPVNTDATCQTDAARTGLFWDRTAAAEKISFVVGGQTGPIYTRSGSYVNTTLTGTLAVTKNAAALQAATTGTLVQVGNTDGASTRVLVDAYGTGVAPIVTSRLARGTAAAPTAVQTDDTLGSHNAYAYGATGYSSTFRARLAMAAAENWTDLAQGTYITFGVTTIGALTAVEALRLTDTTATFGGAISCTALTASGIITSTLVSVGSSSSTGNAVQFAGSLGINASSTATASAVSAAHSVNITHTPASASSASVYAINASITIAGSQNTNTDHVINAVLTKSSTGTATNLNAVRGTIDISAASGTTADARAFNAVIGNSGAGTVTDLFGMRISTATNTGGGVITTVTGLHISAQTVGGTNYAINCAGAGLVRVSDATDATSGTAGAVTTGGGIGATKAVWAGTNLTWANGVCSGTVTNAATNTTTALLTLQHNSSGTVANSFGTQILFNLQDDTTANQPAATINAIWTTAATATRTSVITLQCVTGAGAMTTAATVSVAGLTLPAGMSVGPSATTVASGGIFLSRGSSNNPFLVFQNSGTSIAQVRGLSATSLGITDGMGANAWCTFSGSAAAGTTPALAAVGTSTITGGVTDGYNGSLRLTATYDAATVQTVTRHNYFDIPNVLLTGGGPAALTDACVFRFNAAAGTHAALAADGIVAVTFTGVGPTGAQLTIQGWMKINVNGTLRYVPFW